MEVRVSSNFIVNLKNVTSYGFVHFPNNNIIFNFDDEELDVIDMGECLEAPTEEQYNNLNDKFIEAIAAQQQFFDAYKVLLESMIADKKQKLVSSIIEK
jgi:hypothetical protein